MYADAYRMYARNVLCTCTVVYSVLQSSVVPLEADVLVQIITVKVAPLKLLVEGGWACAVPTAVLIVQYVT